MTRDRATASGGALAVMMTIMMSAGATQTSLAQADKSTADGIYSEAQATRGEALSKAQCQVCHGAKLEGSDVGPGLAGEDFRAAWNGRSVYELFDKIKATMPANAPGDLTDAQTADLVAHILKLNEYPAAAADLPGDKAALEQIKLRQK